MKTLQTQGQKAIPQLGQGTWRMGEKDSQKQIEIDALKLGIDLGYLIQEINNKQQQRNIFLRNVIITCYKSWFLQRSQHCMIST